MILMRRAALDGAELDEVDKRIVIQGIEPGNGKEQRVTTPVWGGSGSRMTAEHRDSLDIVIRFTINEKSYRPEERAAVLEAVCAWAAGGGWLTVNYKPGRRIRVVAVQLPAEGDAATRGVYTIVLRAYGVPYWQADASRIRIAGKSSDARSFGVPGNRETVMDFEFTNTSGSSISSLTAAAGSSEIVLTGLGLASGETLSIDHPDTGDRSWLRIRIRGTGGTWRSVYGKRTAGSSNDLTVKPGARTVGFTAGGAGTAVWSCCGRFG